jgi:hypothetical protein
MIFNKKYKHNESTKRKIALSHIGKTRDDKNGRWRGNEVGYNALHTYIKRRLPKTKLCQICLKVPPQALACIGEYNRDLKNWAWYCHSCHLSFDYKNGRKSVCHSEETKRKMGEEHLGNKNGMFGKRHTLETIKKMKRVLLFNRLLKDISIISLLMILPTLVFATPSVLVALPVTIHHHYTEPHYNNTWACSEGIVSCPSLNVTGNDGPAYGDNN